MTVRPDLLDSGRRRSLLWVSVLTLAQGGAAGAAAFATRNLFEALDRSGPLPPMLLTVLGLSGVVIAVTRVVARRSGESLGQSYARDLRIALFDHAAGMLASDIAARRNGYMSLRFVGDMTAFRNWAGLGVPRLIAAMILIPVALSVLCLLAPVLGLVILPLVIAALAMIALGGLRLPKLHRRLRLRRARIAADMAERMPLAPQLDRLGRRGTERRQMQKRINAMTQAALARVGLAESLKAVPDLFAGLAVVLVLLAGARNGLAPGTIAGALAALGLLLAPMRDLASVGNFHAAWRAAAAKADAALNRRQRPGQHAGRKRLPRRAVPVIAHDFAMPSGAVFDLQVNAGTTAALPQDDADAAHLMNALQGLEAVPAGTVFLGMQDLCQLSRGSLRRGVVRVHAEPPILQGSLRRVLTLGVSSRPDDVALTRIAMSAGLGPMIERLGGLNSTVREGGSNLSRAERTAISLVRAWQLDPRVILVDDSAISLDAKLQETVEQWLAASDTTVLRRSTENMAASALATALSPV